MKKLIVLTLLFVMSLCVHAQISENITWKEDYKSLCLLMNFQYDTDNIIKIDNNYSKYIHIEKISKYRIYTTYKFYNSTLCNIEIDFHEVIGSKDELIIRKNILEQLKLKYGIPYAIKGEGNVILNYKTNNSIITYIRGKVGWSNSIKVIVKPTKSIVPSLTSQISKLF